MTEIDRLIEANARFAQTDAKERVPAIPFVPNRQLYIVTCIDPRVDPAQVFGLDLGDAIVARTVGGRVTRAVLDDLAWISYLHEVKTPDTGWFQVAIVHHTDCGSALMADDGLRAGFVARGFDDATLRATAVTEPRRTAAVDADLLRADPHVSGRIGVSAWAYDVATGLAACVTPPRSRDAG